MIPLLMDLLIIEDDPTVGPLLRDVFVSDGHTATLMRSGEAGLDYLASERPDAVLLDVQLPRISGIEVLRRIRSKSPDLPVVVITGHATPEQIAQAKALGVVEVLEKPEILNEVHDALKRLGAGGSTRR